MMAHVVTNRDKICQFAYAHMEGDMIVWEELRPAEFLLSTEDEKEVVSDTILLFGRKRGGDSLQWGMPWAFLPNSFCLEWYV